MLSSVRYAVRCPMIRSKSPARRRWVSMSSGSRSTVSRRAAVARGSGRRGWRTRGRRVLPWWWCGPLGSPCGGGVSVSAGADRLIGVEWGCAAGVCRLSGLDHDHRQTTVGAGWSVASPVTVRNMRDHRAEVCQPGRGRRPGRRHHQGRQDPRRTARPGTRKGAQPTEGRPGIQKVSRCRECLARRKSRVFTNVIGGLLEPRNVLRRWTNLTGLASSSTRLAVPRPQRGCSPAVRTSP